MTDQPRTHEIGIEQLRRDLAALDRAERIAEELEIESEDDLLFLGMAALMGERINV